MSDIGVLLSLFLSFPQSSVTNDNEFLSQNVFARLFLIYVKKYMVQEATINEK